MKWNLRDGLIVVTVLGLIGGIFVLRQKEDRVAPPQQVEVLSNKGEAAPDFTLPTLQGEDISLRKCKGKPVFVQFWASWCGACKTEMPDIQKVYEKYKDEVHFFAVNAAYQDDRGKVEELMKKEGYTFPVLLDTAGACFNAYRVQGLPTSFLISSEGTILSRNTGAMTEDELKSMLKPVLQEKQGE